MTREEAIEVLESMKSEESYNAIIDLCNMAIDALQFTEHFDLLKEYESLQEVVMCKDCKWYKPKHKDKEYDCPQGLYAIYENDFCSHGERSE